jgi:trehalose/maltose hydrolase-like predicted phosphorylase
VNGWSVAYDTFDPAQERLREALCALGNGYFTTRGAAPESPAGRIHYPGTYIAGCYNRLPTEIAGRAVEHEDLVNMPNWLPLTFRTGAGAWFSLEGVEILSCRQELDLRRGVLERDVRFRDEHRRTTRLQDRRLVSMASPHLAAVETTVTPEDWSGRIEVRTGIDGRVVNGLVDRYRDLPNCHLVPLEAAANAYTNAMAAWVLWRAIEVLDLLPADGRRLLCERLAVTESEVAEWDRVSRRLRLVFQADGLLSQFEGYDALLEFEWAAYRRRHGHLYRLDFILEAEGDTTNRYRLSKQPDVLMLFYLFSAEDCRRSSRAWDTRSTGVASRARSTITFSGARATRPSAGSPTRGSSRARTGPGPGTCSRRRFSAMWRISRAGRLPKAFTWAPWLARSTCSSAATRGSSSATTFSGSTRGCPTRCDASGSSSGTGATRSGSTSGAIGSR